MSTLARQNIIQLIVKILNDHNLVGIFKEVLKGVALTGGGAFVGSLAAGPIGIAVGGTTGAVAGSLATYGKFGPWALQLLQAIGALIRVADWLQVIIVIITFCKQYQGLLADISRYL